MPSSRIRSFATGLVVVGLAMGSTAVLVRAAAMNAKYAAEVQRLRQEWRSQQQAEGLSGSAQQKSLYGKYPTPELVLAKVVHLAPGQTATLAATGTFPPRTMFLLEHDQVTLGTPTVGATAFSAPVTAAPDAIPGFARLFAYAPVSGAWRAAPAVLIGTPPHFDLTASNGWMVKVVPQAKAFTVQGEQASVAYVAEFYRSGEATPFETASGTVSLEGGQAPSDEWSFSISAAGAGSAMAEMQAIQSQMSDPNAFMKMTDAQRDALMARLEAVTERMGKEAEAMVADPAAAQRKQDAFGCQYLSLKLAGAAVTGAVSCGKDVGRLDLTGTRK
jgi:hypothetical protein